MLSAVEGVDENAPVAVGVPVKDPNHTLPSRRFSGGKTKPSHARSRAAAAAILQIVLGVAFGAAVVILARRALRAASDGRAKVSAHSTRTAHATEPGSPPKRATAPETHERDRETRALVASLAESNAALETSLSREKEVTARLWTLVDALRFETAAVKSLARRETCDAESLAPLCASLSDEPQYHLPARVARRTSDLRFRRLWGSPNDDPSPVSPTELLAITVGTKLMSRVDEVVRRFDERTVQVVLFHYDGAVDAWSKFPWSENAVHVSAEKQSKWWFAKRFLHPDIVEPYERVWVWDEDIDVTGVAGASANALETASSSAAAAPTSRGRAAPRKEAPFDPKAYARIVTENCLEK